MLVCFSFTVVLSCVFWIISFSGAIGKHYTVNSLQLFVVIVERCESDSYSCWLPLSPVLNLWVELRLHLSYNYVFHSSFSQWQMMTGVEKLVKETSCCKMKNDASDRKTIPVSTCIHTKQLSLEYRAAEQFNLLTVNICFSWAKSNWKASFWYLKIV